MEARFIYIQVIFCPLNSTALFLPPFLPCPAAVPPPPHWCVKEPAKLIPTHKRGVFGSTARFNQNILVRLSSRSYLKLFWLGFGHLRNENLDVLKYLFFIIVALLLLLLILKAGSI